MVEDHPESPADQLPQCPSQLSGRRWAKLLFGAQICEVSLEISILLYHPLTPMGRSATNANPVRMSTTCCGGEYATPVWRRSTCSSPSPLPFLLFSPENNYICTVSSIRYLATMHPTNYIQWSPGRHEVSNTLQGFLFCHNRAFTVKKVGLDYDGVFDFGRGRFWRGDGAAVASQYEAHVTSSGGSEFEAVRCFVQEQQALVEKKRDVRPCILLFPSFQLSIRAFITYIRHWFKIQLTARCEDWARHTRRKYSREYNTMLDKVTIRCGVHIPAALTRC
jgi:hypothetical protein